MVLFRQYSFRIDTPLLNTYKQGAKYTVFILISNFAIPRSYYWYTYNNARFFIAIEWPLTTEKHTQLFQYHTFKWLLCKYSNNVSDQSPFGSATITKNRSLPRRQIRIKVEESVVWWLCSMCFCYMCSRCVNAFESRFKRFARRPCRRRRDFLFSLCVVHTMHKNVVRCLVSEIYCFSALPNNHIYTRWCWWRLPALWWSSAVRLLARPFADRLLVTEYNIIT